MMDIFNNQKKVVSLEGMRSRYSGCGIQLIKCFHTAPGTMEDHITTITRIASVFSYHLTKKWENDSCNARLYYIF